MELENIHLTFASQIESSDAGRRLISGVVLPFNTIGNTSAGPVQFNSGSVEIPDAKRIKLLAQHSQNDPIGRAQSFQVTQDAIYGTFKVSASQKGNDYLIMAQEELISSLSIGVDVIKAKKNADGVLVVSAARMVEVSLVESPAYPDAIVTKVAASEGEAVEENQPKQESEAILDNKAPEPTEEKAEAATPIVEASRPVTSTPFISTSVRSPIKDFAGYTEHKIKAALGNDESRLFISAADDSVGMLKYSLDCEEIEGKCETLVSHRSFLKYFDLFQDLKLEFEFKEINENSYGILCKNKDVNHMIFPVKANEQVG